MGFSTIHDCMSDPTPKQTPVTSVPRRPRLLLLTSHAIQYQAPLLRAMAQDPRFQIHVALCSGQGAEIYKDEGFGQEVKWDVPLLEGYSHEILRNLSPVPNASRFWGLINPGIVLRIWSGRFDVLVLHSWSSVSAWMAVIAAWLSGLPMILKPEANIYSPTKPWKAGLKRFVLSNLFGRMAAILASGRYGVDFFRHYGVSADKITIAPYAVNNEFFIAKAESLRPQRSELRKAMGVEGDTPVIVFVGKIYEGKRPFDLLRAFAVVRQKIESKLIFVGSGEQLEALQEWVQKETVPDVYFAGFRNQTELPSFLTAADIFVLPSALETWGLVVNEAMCFSLPVIVTDRVGAGGDLARHGENGYVYPVGDVSALAGHLETLVRDAALRRRMGEESFRIIQRWSYREDLEVIASAVAHVIPAVSFPK